MHIILYCQGLMTVHQSRMGATLYASDAYNVPETLWIRVAKHGSRWVLNDPNSRYGEVWIHIANHVDDAETVGI